MKKIILFGIFMLFSISLFAQNIPTVAQIYQDVEHGNLSGASQMMQVVLQAHPNSAKAHYVDAEILAREGRLAQARSEFQTAKNLSPELSFVSQSSVNELKSVLYAKHRRTAFAGSSHFPFVALILFIVAVLFILLIIRSFRQKQNALSRPYTNNANNGSTSSNTQGGYQNSRGGFGGIGSGLASGLAAGVGFAAGEELFNHFTHDNNSDSDNSLPQDDSVNQPPLDQDFGISDDSSWGDDSSGDFGGDDSW